jgi:hypothetical protein
MAGIDEPGIANAWHNTVDLKTSRQHCIRRLLRQLGIAIRQRPNLQYVTFAHHECINA